MLSAVVRPRRWRDDASPAACDDPSPARCDPAASAVFDYEAIAPELRAADVFAVRSRRSRRAVVSSSLVRSDGGLPPVPAPPSPPGAPEPAVIAALAGRRVGSSHLPLHLRQRRARLSVFVVLAVTAGLTVLALLTARSPAVPTTSSVSTAPVVSVTTGGRVGVDTAGLAPTIEPPPAAAPGTTGLSGAANGAPAP